MQEGELFGFERMSAISGQTAESIAGAALSLGRKMTLRF